MQKLSQSKNNLFISDVNLPYLNTNAQIGMRWYPLHKSMANRYFADLSLYQLCSILGVGNSASSPFDLF